MKISSKDAMKYAYRLIKEEGILVVISIGAAAVRVANYPKNADKTIVVILPDSAEHFLTTALLTGMLSEKETLN